MFKIVINKHSKVVYEKIFENRTDALEIFFRYWNAGDGSDGALFQNDVFMLGFGPTSESEITPWV